MANEEHVRRLLDEGVEAWNAWRESEPDVTPDLIGADLSYADLTRANLIGANLSHTNLIGATLFDTNLSHADLLDTNLNGTNLIGANLIGAFLHNANLIGATLSGADLSRANLTRADLTDALIDRHTNFEGVTVSGETKGLGPWIFNPDRYIIREIEFPPEYRQAGISIMTYFAEVMRDKYPDIPATVQITQEELTCRMTIETDTGHREIVEKTLEEYGLVVSGRRQPAELLPNAIDVFRLENQLSLTKVQLESERRALQLTEQQYSSRIASLEGEVDHLRQLVGDQLCHADRLVDVLEVQAFAPLRSLFDRGLTEADKAEVQRILTAAGQQSPRLLQRLAEQITVGAIGGTIGGVNAALVTPWLKEVAHQLGIVIRLWS
jgi:hypothetical protein